MMERQRWVNRGSAALLMWAVLLVTTFSGCQSVRLQPEMLPEEPIAFVYWQEKAARKRGESFENAGELPPLPEEAQKDPLTQYASIRAYLNGQQSFMLSQKLRKHSGYLSLYWPRTGEVERIEAAPANARPLAWSPDHRRLLFVSSHRNGREQLYEYDLDREDLAVLTVGPAVHTRGDYDAEGGLVIQKSEPDTRAPLGIRESAYLATQSGRIERLIADGIPPGNLALGPARNFLVYEQVQSRPRTDGPTVYLSSIAIRSIGAADGSVTEEKTLTRGREPVLTPEGDGIVFASPSSAGYRLRRMRLDGTSRVPLGRFDPGGPAERMPAVSPKGDFVAFIEEKPGSRRLAIRRFDSREKDRIILSKGWSEFPVW